jgi:FKBP-type peptidyl-prolyl cis-trans isomerase SlpA
MTIPLEILPGSQVTLHLAIRLEDGTEALSTFDEDPG